MFSETVADHRTGHPSPKPGVLGTGVFSLLTILVEVAKQTIVFAVRHFNTTKLYPFYIGSIVFCTELSKFLFCYLIFCVQHRRMRFMPSPVFVFPAFFLVAANSAFLYCVYYIAPPTWNIFLQSRAVFTALGGFVVFGRPIERRTWVAMVLLVVTAMLAVLFSPGVVTSQYYPYEEDTKMWVFAAFIGVACSAFLYDSFEYISKLGKRPIAEKHIQLYFFSTVLGFIGAEFTSNGNIFELDIRMFFPLDFYMCVLTLVVWGFGGLGLFILMNRLSTPADEANFIPAWIPPVLFLLSTVVSSLMFPTQQGYSHGVTAVIFLLMGTVSVLYSSGGSSTVPPEQNKVAIIDA
ncbi:uncharacterized protein LOC119731329 isoform X2 [Patiria miniata]|nr:uncharacterized protein LOC119731329 isoform X2 [Patiria miniata]